MEFKAWNKMQRYERYQTLRVKRRCKNFVQMAFWYGLALAIGWTMGTYSAYAHPCRILLSREINGESELKATMGGEYAGYSRYRMLDATRAYVTGMWVERPFKGLGISKAFIYAMLLRHPGIKHVSSILVWDNLQASGLAMTSKEITQEQCVEAVSRTPFVKAFKRFGFAVTDCRWNPAMSFLEVEMSI